MTERPAICFVALNAFPLLAERADAEVVGGAEVQQVLAARGLAQRGYRVSMVCRDFGQPHGVEIGKITVHKAFRLEAGIPILRFASPRLTGIWRCLREADADIYYQRTAGMLTGVVAAFCARTGKRSLFAAAGNPDLERRTSRIQYARDRWLYEYGIRNVDRILVQNDEQARLCRDNFARHATLVPNCYPAPRVNGAEKPSLILWVSTIRPVKRPELFLDLARAMPAHRFRMIGGAGAGAEAERLYRSLKARAAAIPNLELTGFVPYSRIDTHFDQASVVVNTSESEGFPNTFLQAWSRGLPTVSFVDSGARMDEEPVGRRVASLGEMRECVERWMSGEEERRRLGDRCRRYYEAHHSPDRVLDIYERVIGELVGR